MPLSTLPLTFVTGTSLLPGVNTITFLKIVQENPLESILGDPTSNHPFSMPEVIFPRASVNGSILLNIDSSFYVNSINKTFPMSILIRDLSEVN
jgi:hypothetical protein